MARVTSLIRDPRAVPVLGADHHLPPLQESVLTPHHLKARFAAATDWQPEFQGDAGGALAGRIPSAAAVLVPLVVREHGLSVLLTRRTDHLRDHAGQISFPGGRVDPGEVDPVVTALREAREEVGLAARHVEVIGLLPTYTTITSYVVTPVVALVHPPFELTLDAFEVAEAQRRFLSMPWQGQTVDGRDREYFIWGATAAMLRNLYGFLANERAQV